GPVAREGDGFGVQRAAIVLSEERLGLLPLGAGDVFFNCPWKRGVAFDPEKGGQGQVFGNVQQVQLRTERRSDLAAVAQRRCRSVAEVGGNEIFLERNHDASGSTPRQWTHTALSMGCAKRSPTPPTSSEITRSRRHAKWAT